MALHMCYSARRLPNWASGRGQRRPARTRHRGSPGRFHLSHAERLAIAGAAQGGDAGEFVGGISPRIGRKLSFGESEKGRSPTIDDVSTRPKRACQFGWGTCHNRLSSMTLTTKKACFCISYRGTTLWSYEPSLGWLESGRSPDLGRTNSDPAKGCRTRRLQKKLHPVARPPLA